MPIYTVNMNIPILMYHSISNDAKKRFRPFMLPPDILARHLGFLGRNGYTPITMREMAEGGSSLPEKPVVLTFDDGFADFYDTAYPLLRDHGFPATLFVSTAYIGRTSDWLGAEGEGGRRMLDWAQVCELASAGVEMGGHSHNHVQLDAVPDPVARAEIIRGKNELEDKTGRPVTSFAYPYGYHSRRVRAMVRTAGFKSACTVANCISGSGDDPFGLPRIWVRHETDVSRLAAILAGEGSSAACRLRRFAGTVRRMADRNIARFRYRNGMWS